MTTPTNPTGASTREWASHSPQEIVRRTRCQADDWSPLSDPATWRACCDLILHRLGAEAAPSLDLGGGEEKGATHKGSDCRPSDQAPSGLAGCAASIPRARPLSEWTEEHGDVLWWRFPIVEPPYCGSPMDLGFTVEVAFRQYGEPEKMRRHQVGGWPGYHTHWTPIPMPDEPPAPKIEARRAEMRSSSVEDESLVTEGQAPLSNHSNDITGAGHD